MLVLRQEGRYTWIMGARRPGYVVALGLLLSLLLHGMVLVPALVGVMRDGSGPDVLRARFSPEQFPEHENDSVPLGIDEGSTLSMTWIGYDEYEEHLAPHSEVEQAAFASSPPGAEAPVGGSAGGAAAQAEAAETATSAAAPAAPPAPDPLGEIATLLAATEPGKDPEAQPTTEKPSPTHDALDEAISRIEETFDRPAAQQQAQAAEAQQQAQPGQPAAQQAENRQVGDVASKESDPTSTVDVPFAHIQIGKPLAAHGLEIRTRRPIFTSLVMLTAAPADPTVELRFRKNGTPAKGTRILQSSGDPRIDEAILNCLFRWRAAGKRLQELPGPEDTIPIRMKIILSQRMR